MQEQADVRMEIARLWSGLAKVNARVDRSAHGRDVGLLYTTVAGANLAACEARFTANLFLAAYGRLYRAAHAVEVGLHRECDHVTYQGDPAAVDALAVELEDARQEYGAGLLEEPTEGDAHHG